VNRQAHDQCDDDEGCHIASECGNGGCTEQDEHEGIAKPGEQAANELQSARLCDKIRPVATESFFRLGGCEAFRFGVEPTHELVNVDRPGFFRLIQVFRRHAALRPLRCRIPDTIVSLAGRNQPLTPRWATVMAALSSHDAVVDRSRVTWCV
jgi:hypothetical protein